MEIRVNDSLHVKKSKTHVCVSHFSQYSTLQDAIKLNHIVGKSYFQSRNKDLLFLYHNNNFLLQTVTSTSCQLPRFLLFSIIFYAVSLNDSASVYPST